MLENLTDVQVLKFDMGKWWDYYKCYVKDIYEVINLLNTEAPAIRVIQGKKILFTAKDKLNRIFNYEYLGHIQNNSFGNIELFNIDLQESTIVELEWFNQREIKSYN